MRWRSAYLDVPKGRLAGPALVTPNSGASRLTPPPVINLHGLEVPRTRVRAERNTYTLLPDRVALDELVRLAAPGRLMAKIRRLEAQDLGRGRVERA